MKTYTRDNKPDHLKTKTELLQLGYSTRKSDLPEPVAQLEFYGSKMKLETASLYDMNQAIKHNQRTEKPQPEYYTSRRKLELSFPDDESSATRDKNATQQTEPEVNFGCYSCAGCLGSILAIFYFLIIAAGSNINSRGGDIDNLSGSEIILGMFYDVIGTTPIPTVLVFLIALLIGINVYARLKNV